MTLLIQTRPAAPTPSAPPRTPLFLLLAILTLVLVFFGLHFSGDTEEAPDLLPDLKEKLERELFEIDHAQQYVLRATDDGNYPCYRCPGRTTIFLRRGEIWRYGVTRKGESGRYPAGLADQHLFYQVEFEGNYAECLKQEKTKIYHYAIHPENLRRSFRLDRPPGNARTD